MSLTHLLAVLSKESRGIHAIGDSAADEGEPVENDWGLVGVLEEDLVHDVQKRR